MKGEPACPAALVLAPIRLGALSRRRTGRARVGLADAHAGGVPGRARLDHILRKCRAFHGLDLERVARMGAAEVGRLLGKAKIVRHRGKIEATICGSKFFLAAGGSNAFRDRCWAWVDYRSPQPAPATVGDVPAQTLLSSRSDGTAGRGLPCPRPNRRPWLDAGGGAGEREYDGLLAPSGGAGDGGGAHLAEGAERRMHPWM